MSENPIFNQLTDYVRQNLGIETKKEDLKGLAAFLVTNPLKVRTLCLSERISEERATYVVVKMAAHVLLGHVNLPYKSIFEPMDDRFELKPDELEESRKADILVESILNNQLTRSWQLIWEINPGINDPTQVSDIRMNALEMSRILH